MKWASIAFCAQNVVSQASKSIVFYRIEDDSTAGYLFVHWLRNSSSEHEMLVFVGPSSQTYFCFKNLGEGNQCFSKLVMDVVRGRNLIY